MEIKKNNTLAICVKNLIDLKYLEQSFRLYFGDVLNIVAIPLNELGCSQLDPKAVVTTHLTTEPARKKFPQSEIVFAARGLTGESLEEVVQLPRGTKALIASSPRQVAIETKEALLALGIDHIEATAYWPGAPISIEGNHAVIYAGIRDYCPKGNYKYINIGHRSIAISTIINILRTFELSADFATRYYNDNIRQVTDSCYKLAAALNQTEQMKDSFEKVCDFNESILFAIDNKEKILIFNRSATNFFGIGKKKAVGKNYKDVLVHHPMLIESIYSGKELKETLITVKGQKLLISSYNFYIEGYDNRLISILPVAALQRSESQARMKLHSSGFFARYKFTDILGGSESISRCKAIAQIYANTHTTVLITGESGTGKELFAQAIHNASHRAAYPFVGINFAALPETLAESELFGYNEGAFTGAMKGGKEGLFEIAHNGTIFLDEIGDASLAIQAKLLRVLEEKEIIRVGGTKVIPIDVRIICATNRNLQQMMKEGSFRPDLYYRIKVLNLHLEPLRRRREDILTILYKMLKSDAGKQILDQGILDYLLNYHWPGNIRELSTVAEYINMLADMRGSGDYGEAEIREMLCFFLETNLWQEYPDTDQPFALNKGLGNHYTADSGTATPYIGPDLLLILKGIEKLQKQSITCGRGSLGKLPEITEAGLTETKIKTRLKRLEAMGLVTIGVTKQGVSLTFQGAQTLKKAAAPLPLGD